MNKLIKWSFPMGIVVVWILAYSLDTTVWSKGAILWVQTIIPLIMTVTGIAAFVNYDKWFKNSNKGGKDNEL